MDDKKIFKILQGWFPLLKHHEIPKKKYRGDFQQFRAWLATEQAGQHEHAYLMSIDVENPYENGLERCAMLQHKNIDMGLIQQSIRNRATPLYQHYQKHKEVIGKYYNVNAHVFDIVFEEIYAFLKLQNFELLIIYAETAYWMAVPDEDVRIHKFCKSFSKQFKHEGICIEHYIKLDCLRST